MCGRFTVKATWAELVAFYRLTMDAPPHNLRPRYNVCPTDPVDVVTAEEGNGEADTYVAIFDSLTAGGVPMSFVGCTDEGHQTRLVARIISRGIIGGILVAGAVVVGTFLPGHSPHIDTDIDAPGRSPPAIAQTATSTTALSWHSITK